MTLLTLTTLIALVVALVATGVAWRLWRESRARAAARVLALEAAIAQDSGTGPSSREGGRSWSASLVPAIDPGDTTLFSATLSPEPGGRRVIPLVGVGAVVVSLVAVLLVGAGGLGTATDAPTPMPIELLSMRHASEKGEFVIAGLVRNPGGSPERERVSAVAFFFDDRGGFITSARAPLDVARLRPGNESAFEVKLPRPAGLERYRLSFRTFDGAVLPHIDSREAKAR